MASIINCFYRKLYADGDKDIQVAVEIKNKIAQKNKSLTKYLNKIDKTTKKIKTSRKSKHTILMIFQDLI